MTSKPQRAMDFAHNVIWCWGQFKFYRSNQDHFMTLSKCTSVIFLCHLWIIWNIRYKKGVWCGLRWAGKTSHANIHDLSGQLLQWCMHIKTQASYLLDNSDNLSAMFFFILRTFKSDLLKQYLQIFFLSFYWFLSLYFVMRIMTPECKKQTNKQNH